jgi:hypothetical protein
VAVLPALADIDALEAWTGDTIPDDDPRALAVLAAASALVRSETRRTWLDDMGALAAIPDEVAARVWNNPDGAIQDVTGPFSARFSERIADGLYLTDTERAICARHRLQSTGVWSLGTTRLGPGAVGADWTPTEDGPLFPFGA